MRNTVRDKTLGQKVKVVCQNCKQCTNHIIEASINVDETAQIVDSDEIYWTNDDYEIIKCLGCDMHSFRHRLEHFQMYDEEGFIPIIKCYPDIKIDSLTPKRYYSAPQNLQSIYTQTIHAYNCQHHILCAGGLRAIVECICKVNGITKGDVVNEKTGRSDTKTNLQGKINGLSESKYLSESDSTVLHELRFLGNDALHEIEKPNVRSLKYAIDIIENIMNSLYLNPSHKQAMGRSRNQKKKSL